MQSNRSNSLDPISISNWRWADFLDETIKAFSIFQSRPYPINNVYRLKGNKNSFIYFSDHSLPKKPENKP